VETVGKEEPTRAPWGTLHPGRNGRQGRRGSGWAMGTYLGVPKYKSHWSRLSCEANQAWEEGKRRGRLKKGGKGGNVKI